MRQSLYLNPQNGDGNNSSDNSLWGYYADGFFDRRAIGVSATNQANSAVVARSSNAAYIGRLFFNPNNDASLFIPASGYRANNDGHLGNAGYTGYVWSSSVRNQNYGWFLSVRSTWAQQSGSAYRAIAKSVRCVKISES